MFADEKRKLSDDMRRQITEFELLKEQLEMKKGDLHVRIIYCVPTSL